MKELEIKGEGRGCRNGRRRECTGLCTSWLLHLYMVGWSSEYDDKGGLISKYDCDEFNVVMLYDMI